MSINAAIGPGSYSSGPSSPSTSLDSDNDTDIDSNDANILVNDYGLRPPYQHYSLRHSSLAPDERVLSEGRSHRPQEPDLDVEEKYHFDDFWDHFHSKRKRPPELRSLDNKRSSTCSLNGAMEGRSSLYDARAYEIPNREHLLVDFVRNGWRKNSYNNVHSGWSNPNPAPFWTQILSAPRIRRWILIFFVSVSLSWLYWRRYGQDAWTEHKTLNNAVNGRIRSDLGYFGTNMLPEFVGMTQVKTLDTYLVPGSRDSRRLIFVGDIHGCYDEFASLLRELSFDSASDHLVLTGDLISKGPSSPAVIDLAISSNASCVRGNHEDRVLLAYRDLNYHHRLTQQSNSHAEGDSVPTPPNPGNPDAAREAEPDAKADDRFGEEHFTSGDPVDQQLARTLSKKQISYLASCPVILDVGPVRGMGEVRAVHAGLVPGVSLRRQDPISVMHMRTLDIKSHVPSRGSKGTPWSKIWNKYQRLLPESQRSTVIYGHDSHRGLRLEKYSKGLDTGCVKGGQLTALIFSSGFNPKPKVTSVGCKNYRPRRAATGELGSS